MKLSLSIFALFLGLSLSGQVYFPPTTGNQWDTVSAASIGWCTSEQDTLVKYLESRNSKAFLILHKGRIVVEEYMNGFGLDSIWYWASAGKSLMAFLIGIAQEDGLLSITDKTSQYLDTGWTSAPRAKEDLIEIRHQLSMTSGLDHNAPNQNCLTDTCLDFLHDAGTHWYYYNAPYRLTQDVLEAASGTNLNLYTLQSLTNTTGIAGLWFNYVFFSRARDMARFGILCLNEGKWNNKNVLSDTSYFRDMVTKSQNLNEAYGYLWWLNGGTSFKQPGFDIVFPGEIIPTAPSDLYMAAGKNDQRIYVVPSLDLVVVRQGDAAYSSLPALSSFDVELWELIMNLVCNQIDQEEVALEESLQAYPNPTKGIIHLSDKWGDELEIISVDGKVLRLSLDGRSLNIGFLPAGIYLLRDPRSGYQMRVYKR